MPNHDANKVVDATLTHAEMPEMGVSREISIDPDDIESGSIAARALAGMGGGRGRGPTQEATFDEHGHLLRTVITTKDFLAGAEAFDYVNGLAKGSVATLGTLAGQIYGVEKKSSEWQGKMLTSYWLRGTFQAQIGVTGEVVRAPQAILPKAYGIQVMDAFQHLGIGVATVGVTVGLRLSGRPGIPYEWVVTDHMIADTTKVVANISNQLAGLIGKPALPAPPKQKRIAG
jgi:hypothetical protein